MFVYYYAHIDRSLEATKATLLRTLDSLNGWASAAYREGEALRVRIGIGRDSQLVAKAVALTPSEPIEDADQITLPIAWEATGTPGLFPKMTGDLLLTRIGDHMTQLTLRGSYNPPMGPLGRILDRALLHRLAETSVKHFVDQIAAELQQPSPSTQPANDPPRNRTQIHAD